MGSSKKAKAKIDKFFMSAHYGVCLGADELREVVIKEKSAWAGRATDNTTLGISKENLFGGILKEGGVSGQIDVMFGRPTQKASSWLASKLGRTPDTAPGYRGMLSLVFRSGSRGFYWTASTPYLGALWARVARYPRSLDPQVSKIPRAPGLPVSIFFVLDDSGSMSSGNRLPTMKAAVNSALDLLPVGGTRVDVGGSTFNSRSASYPNASEAQLIAFRSWVNGLPASGGTSFDTGMQYAVDWFEGTRNDASLHRRIMVFLTDGEPTGNSDDVARATALHLINRQIPVDIYCANIDLSNTTAIGKIDNTPEDGLPVVTGDNPDALTNVLERALLGSAATFDANPANIIYECVTDTDWGLGWPVGSVDVASFQHAARVLYGERFGLSLIWAQSDTVEAFANDILDCIKGSLFTNPRNGKLTLRLIRDDYKVSDLRSLNPDNAKLTNFSRKSWGETVNEVKVTWTNPANESAETVYVQDLGNIAMQGAVISDAKNYHGVRRADLAQQLANRDLRQSSAALCSCEATVDRSYWDITPFDCVELTWPDYDLDAIVMRVVNVNYGATGSSAIKLSLVEDVFSLPEVTFVAPPPGEWVNPDTPPERLTDGRIFPAPAYMAAQAGLDIGNTAYPMASAGLLVGHPGGASLLDYVYEAEEPTPNGGKEWAPVGEPQDFMGVAKLPEGLTREAFSTVELSHVNGQAVEANSFLLIGSVSAPARELELALVTAVDEDTGVATLLRGALDTVPKEWPADTPVWIGSVDEFIPIQDEYVTGQTVVFRVGDESTGEYVTFSDTVLSRMTRPLRPANVKINGQGFSADDILATSTLNITWSHRNRTMEDVTVLPWTGSSVTPEAGTIYRVSADAYSISGTLLEADWLNVSVGLVDTYSVDLAGLEMPSGTAQLRFRVIATRDEEDSWQDFEITVNVLAPPTDLVLEWMDVHAPTGLTVEPLE